MWAAVVIVRELGSTHRASFHRYILGRAKSIVSFMQSTVGDMRTPSKTSRTKTTYHTGSVTRARVHDEGDDETVQTQDFGEDEDEDLWMGLVIYSYTSFT